MSTKSASTSQLLVIEVRQPPSSERGVDWLSLAPSAVAGLVAFLGWIIVERFARARERRADLRALTNSFRDTIDDILADATKYYQTEEDTAEAASLAMSVKSKLALLPQQLTVLTSAGLPMNVGDQLKHFRQAVTGGDFESADRLPSPAKAQIFVAMVAAGQNLNRAVQLSLYRDLVQPASGTWWRSIRKRFGNWRTKLRFRQS